MDDCKEKIKELEHKLEVSNEANRVLKVGYDDLLDKFIRLTQEYAKLLDNNKAPGVSVNESELLEQFVKLSQEFFKFKDDTNAELNFLRKETYAAVENYNAKIRKLNQLLSEIEDEKIIQKISEIFSQENKDNGN